MSANPTTENITDAVKNFIANELMYSGDAKLNDTTDLIEEGVIDSISLLRLVGFLEEQCKIEVPDEDLVPENFRSLSAIRAYVSRASAAKA